MAIGIPYAFQEYDHKLKAMVATCPKCGERIPLVEMKDFESASGREYAEHWAKEHEKPFDRLDDRARRIIGVPAVCSQKSLQGWIAGIRVKLFDYAPGSQERRDFIAEAQRSIGFACFVLRTRKATVAYLKAESEKLPQMINTEAD